MAGRRTGEEGRAWPVAAGRPVRFGRRAMGEDAYEQVLRMAALQSDGCRLYDRFAGVGACAGIVWC